MNAPITRLFGIVVVLFALLVVFTSRWTVFQASSLNNNPLNVRTLLDELKIKRGRILAARRHGARQVGAGARGHVESHLSDRTAVRPAGRILDRGQGRGVGLEQSAGPDLRGVQTGLDSIFGQLSPRPVGRRRLHDARSQGTARPPFRRWPAMHGSVVALDPSTGAVKVMYANPGYDNNNPPKTGSSTDTTFNRVTQGALRPRVRRSRS